MNKNDRRGLNISKNEMATLRKLDKKRNGAYFKIQYYGECNNKVRAAYKGCYNVTKITEISVRKGIKYNALKSVIEKKMEQGYSPSCREPWYYHIDKMLVKHKKEDKYYVALFPNKFGKAKTFYLLNGKRISREELQDMDIMQPAFWNNSDKPTMFTLALDKIINVY